MALLGWPFGNYGADVACDAIVFHVRRQLLVGNKL
jgi:hypothetical protein